MLHLQFIILVSFGDTWYFKANFTGVELTTVDIIIITTLMIQSISKLLSISSWKSLRSVLEITK